MGVKRSELFDDESDQDDVGAYQAQLQVNEEFAKRFEVRPAMVMPNACSSSSLAFEA